MAAEFRMPSLGPDMESGTLAEWRVRPGDTVERGDIVALVETAKGIIDVEIFAKGRIEELLVQAGAHVPVGTVLARLSNGGEAASARRPEERAEPPAGRQKVTPAARARAQALGVDLARIRGTGIGGAITLDDVDARAQAPDPRQVIGKAMSRSMREIPHFYLSVTADFTAARRWLECHNRSVPIEERLLPSALLLKAVALAARAMPAFNGYCRDGVFSPSREVHVGMAIAMRNGRLAAPAILDADRKGLTVVMHELRDLATRVRAGHMRGSELASPTITVTAMTEDGPELIVPIIYAPQVAMVGFGAILERPWIVAGKVQAAPLITISLAVDHRVADGRAAARFLVSIRDALQVPEKL